MTKLTQALRTAFLAAQSWLIEAGGRVAGSNIGDGKKVVVSARGISSWFLLQNDEPGDYEQGVIQAVDDLKRKLGLS
jgi:hypothetical protein